MNAIIIEDEKIVARELCIKIAKTNPEVKILEILPSVKTAVNWFSENAEPDVVFADIQLADGVSFEIFERFKLSCPIIFITSYNEFAIRAFKVNGIDYLLKPVEPVDLQNAIEKAKSINQKQTKTPIDMNKLMEMLQTGNVPKPAYKEHFLCNHRNAWILVKTKDIAYFCYEMVVHIVTKNNEKFSLDNTMEEIEATLDPDLFYRVNRQYIVNIDIIQKVWGLENLKLMVKLKDPHQATEIDISRQKAPLFKKWLEK
ncbi:LytTR family DNA-binding domain-containing protein [Emticicia sp. C21]|uniref:LytR/AlgR family response regulator transcription factor n=1 Tax=Emticicia sp. C21 TaxID=2302915 RepID=UPI000E343D87|nr:LytTR family DNA-binding domain-containing protein [Emticicia sp. C21]RFS14952.1 DNA-binding response regulator [Emticicia sp. C21]